MPKARENAGDHVVISLSFVSDWLSGVRFLDQSQSEVKQNRYNSGCFRNSIENFSN